MSIMNIFYIGLSILFGAGAILCTGLFLAFASAMQSAERTQK